MPKATFLIYLQIKKVKTKVMSALENQNRKHSSSFLSSLLSPNLHTTLESCHRSLQSRLNSSNAFHSNCDLPYADRDKFRISLHRRSASASPPIPPLSQNGVGAPAHDKSATISWKRQWKWIPPHNHHNGNSLKGKTKKDQTKFILLPIFI